MPLGPIWLSHIACAIKEQLSVNTTKSFQSDKTTILRNSIISFFAIILLKLTKKLQNGYATNQNDTFFLTITKLSFQIIF